MVSFSLSKRIGISSRRLVSRMPYNTAMQSLQYAYSIIEILNQRGVGAIFREDDRFVIPKNDGSPLVSISNTAILINQTDFNDRLIPSRPSKLKNKIETSVLNAFINDILSASEVKLNHFGVSYYCTDLDVEVSNIKKLLGDNELYEESTESPSARWLFVGNVGRPSEPLFELVLNERKNPTLSSWTPHFQIDIDTALPYVDLQKVIKDHFGDNWIKWNIDVENWGVPLVVGRLCSIDGLKVYLGIGTNKRGREWHRKEALKQL